MSANAGAVARPEPIIYPSSDGKRIAGNMTQSRWIMFLYENLNALVAADPNTFVAADSLWFPVEGDGNAVMAPDVYVVFGRPKGDRPSYRQWEEGGVPVTVAFEILSPSNGHFEMADRLAFYDEHQVEEYYVYDPYSHRLLVYQRGQATLRRRMPPHGFVSPRLGIRFELPPDAEMVIRYPDGRPFVHLAEERKRADHEHQLRVRLQQLSRKVRRGQATPEEIAELDRLEETNGA